MIIKGLKHISYEHMFRIRLASNFYYFEASNGLREKPVPQ